MQTRAETGLLPPTSVTFVRLTARTEFFVHYEGAHPLTQPHSGCGAKVREFQRFHMEQRGWSDIGYNFLVCQHGTVFEGRGWTAVGAHCPDHNTTGIGAQFMVGGDQVPSDAAKNAMRDLYLEACRLTGRPLAQKGHRDGFATECPGAAAYAWVKAGMPATEEAKDWFDMASLDDLRKVLREPDYLREVARFVLTGYTSGPEGEQNVLIGHLTRIAALAAADLTPEQVEVAVRKAIDTKYDATVTLSPKAGE